MVLLATLLGWIGTATAHVPVTVTVFPEDDWCAIVGSGLTGDVYLLTGGDYHGPCTIPGPVPDQYGERVVVRSFDPYVARAVLHGDGVADHIVQLTGYEVSLEDLDLVGDGLGLDAVRFEGDGHRVARSRFTGEVGRAIRQVGSGSGLEVVDTSFDLPGSQVAVSLGCPGCSSTDHLVHQDRIAGAAVGLVGVEGAAGTVRDVVFVETSTGIDWSEPGDPTVIEENLVVALVDGLRVQGGSLVARNNVVVGPHPLTSVGPGVHRLYGNTLFGPGDGLVLEGWGDGAGLDLRSNAWTGEGPSFAGARQEGNVACSGDACDCWVSPSTLDFHPPPGSPLRDGGAPMAFGELNADWCGNPRPEVPTAGAFQAVSPAGPGPLSTDFKDACAIPLDPDPATLPCAASEGDSGPLEPDPPVRTRDREGRAGCGCSVGRDGAAWWAVVGVLTCVGARRRRRF